MSMVESMLPLLHKLTKVGWGGGAPSTASRPTGRWVQIRDPALPMVTSCHRTSSDQGHIKPPPSYTHNLRGLSNLDHSQTQHPCVPPNQPFPGGRSHPPRFSCPPVSLKVASQSTTTCSSETIHFYLTSSSFSIPSFPIILNYLNVAI